MENVQTVAAKEVRKGDRLYNSAAHHPSWLWIPALEVVAEDDRIKIRTTAWETIKHPEEGVLIQRNQYADAKVPDDRVAQYPCLRLHVKHWFGRQDFQLWLNAHTTTQGYRSHATWHQDWPGYGKPGEYSDVLVFWDGGEGSDFEIMPEDIWDEITRICEQRGLGFAVIWLVNEGPEKDANGDIES